MIDPSSLSWNHVLEFRDDKDSMAALRDVRLLFHTDYKDKPLSYIKDDIARRVQIHDTVTKKWGFELASKSFSALFSKEAALTGLVSGTLISTGAGVIGGAVAAIGLVGSVAIEGIKTVREKKFDEKSSMVRYFSKLNSIASDFEEKRGA